jgi:hypothetical protein
MKTNQMNTKHISHLEDIILTGDLSVLNFFDGDYEVSLKLDGSPAVFWGFDPNNGKFFVSLKSIFNKIKKKVCYSVEDIQFYYQNQPKLIEVLIACFHYLPKEKGIFSGDFIGFGGLNVYTPNTITYQFPEVVTQSIIIAPHTKWSTNGELRDAYVSGSAPFFNDTEHVKFVQPCVDMIRPVLPEIDTTGVQFLSVKESTESKKQINALIRAGEELSWTKLTDILGCKYLAHLYLTMIELKEDLVYCMIISDAPKSYLNGKEIIGEGFVCKNDKMILKLVDRPVFSHYNFVMQKSWQNANHLKNK